MTKCPRCGKILKLTNSPDEGESVQYFNMLMKSVS